MKVCDVSCLYWYFWSFESETASWSFTHLPDRLVVLAIISGPQLPLSNVFIRKIAVEILGKNWYLFIILFLKLSLLYVSKTIKYSWQEFYFIVWTVFSPLKCSLKISYMYKRSLFHMYHLSHPALPTFSITLPSQFHALYLFII